MIEKITLGQAEYPIAFDMLVFSRITKDLGADNLTELFTKVEKLGNATGAESLASIAEVLEPMAIIAHHGLYRGGVLSGEIYKLSIEETQGLFSDFNEVIGCFTLFMNQFASFFTGAKTEPAPKKKAKVNP